MQTLSLDTTQPLMSIALMNGDVVNVVEVGEHTSTHVEHLIPSIEKQLKQEGWSFTSLGGITVCVGPGSFTGVRMGIAAAKGIRLVHEMPIFAVTSFEAMYSLYHKQANMHKRSCFVAIDARRGECYTQIFNGKGEGQLPKTMTYKEVQDLVGSDASMSYVSCGVIDALAQLDWDCCDVFTAQDVAQAVTICGKQPVEHMVELVPLYIRPPDAKPANR